MTLILYTRSDCHLCELAQEALRHANVDSVVSINIEDEVKLEEIYGNRIPVLVDTSSSRELNWPFDAWTIRQFCKINLT